MQSWDGFTLRSWAGVANMFDMMVLIKQDLNGLYWGCDMRLENGDWKVLNVLEHSDMMGSFQWLDLVWKTDPERVATIQYKEQDQEYETIFDGISHQEFLEFMSTRDIERIEDVGGAYKGRTRQC